MLNGFRYVFAYIANCHIDFKQCRRLVWNQFWNLAAVSKSKDISLSSNFHLSDSLILSIIFYNAPTWTATKMMKKEIYSFGINSYRYMLGIRRIDRVKNEEVLERVRKNNLKNLLYKRQLRFYEHWIYKDDIFTYFSLYINNDKRNQWEIPRMNNNEHIEKFTSGKLQSCKEKQWIQKSLRRKQLLDEVRNIVCRCVYIIRYNM